MRVLRNGFYKYSAPDGAEHRRCNDGKSTADELLFDFAGGSNVKPKTDMHMHSLRLRFENKDAIATEWDMFDAGKKVDAKKFFLTRKS